MARWLREIPGVSDSVGMCLESGPEHPLLTADDEVHLAWAMERGGWAQQELDASDSHNPARRAALYRDLHNGDEVNGAAAQPA